MSRVILVRHGRTSWNEGDGERFRGRAEIDLDEVGLSQARATAKRLAGDEVEALYSSPLARAVTTARYMGDTLGVEPQLSEHLTDIDYGIWQGLLLGEAEAEDKRLYDMWRTNPALVTFPGGEGLGEVGERAMALIETLLSIEKESTSLVVTHKIVCKVLLCTYLGLDNLRIWQVEQSPCGISVISRRGDRLVVSLMNDTCHLEGLR